MGRAATIPAVSNVNTATAARSTDATLTGLLAGGLLAAPDPEFVRLGLKFREELAPRDLWETLQAELVLLALAMLRRAVAALVGSPDDAKLIRGHASSHRMLTGALREFAKLRKRKLEPAGVAVSATPPTPNAHAEASPRSSAATGNGPARPPAPAPGRDEPSRRPASPPAIGRPTARPDAGRRPPRSFDLPITTRDAASVLDLWASVPSPAAATAGV